MLPLIYGEMRVVNDAELRFTPAGKAVANFRAVSNDRRKGDDGKWEDGDPCWVNITAWGKLAENVAESCLKGRLVTVKGRLKTREYEDREGVKRTSVDVTADEIGMSIQWVAAKPVGSSEGSGGVERVTSAGDDPFASPAPAAVQSEEPPF
jgi:single-strand DNA-binding protein